MQNNPTSNGQGAGGYSNLTSGQATAFAAAKQNPMMGDGGGMFGGAGGGPATETLGGRRQAGAEGGEGAAPRKKAMQLGKAKKLPNNLNLI